MSRNELVAGAVIRSLKTSFAPILFRERAHTTPHYKHDSRLRYFLTITGHGGAPGLP